MLVWVLLEHTDAKMALDVREVFGRRCLKIRRERRRPGEPSHGNAGL